MDKRLLGNSDISVAPLAFGGNVFGWTLDEKGSFELLDAFVAAGFNLVDTSDTYPRWVPGNKGGESETIIGRWMKERGNRDKIIIATKVGGDMGKGKKDLSKKYILEEAEDSLRRLQTDYIDLYQSHHDDTDTAVEETLEAYSRLVAAGKVRLIGASNLSPERLLQSLEASKREGYPAYQTLQPLYNLYDRETFEKGYESICREHALSVIPYYSLASGFLSGKYRSENDISKSPRGEGIQKKYLNERGLRILEALDQVSRRYDTTPATVAIAWLLANPLVSAPIASATNKEQLNALIRATQLKLDENALAILNKGSGY